MSKNKHKNNKPADEEVKNTVAEEEIPTLTPEDVEILDAEPADAEETTENLEQEILNLNSELEKQKTDYLYLNAEFDNYRKRVLREKSELIKNGGEQVLKGILPVMDDFERGLDAIKDTDSVESVREGMELIYKKLTSFLKQNGVTPMESTGGAFDTDYQEAVAMIPAPDEDSKGKVIDTVQKGYMLNDKVLRHAKVVVGQ